MSAQRKRKYILVVEDSTVDRAITSSFLTESGCEVRCVEDAFQAREEIAKEDPALIVLDIELPRMSGGEFLGHLMRHHPLPVIVVTRGNFGDSKKFEKYQSLGAVSTLCKPTSPDDCSRFGTELLQVVQMIQSFKTCSHDSPSRRLTKNDVKNTKPVPESEPNSFTTDPVVVALGASSGGPVALSEIVRHFHAKSPPILIAQHISDRFLTKLVQGLRHLTDMKVNTAEDGERIAWGNIYVAPPEYHMEIDGAGRIKILSTVPTDRFTPSVNVLFNSLARCPNVFVVAALLTGMGTDGADGLLRLRQAGAITIAQSRETCAVFGMPGRAIEIGAAEHVLKLSEIGTEISHHIELRSNRKNRHTRISELAHNFAK